MLTFLLALLLPAVSAVPFPPPTGPYHVGYRQHIFNHSTPSDPVAPRNASDILLGTLYYPTSEVPISGSNTAPYLDATTAQLWGDILRYPNNSLQSLTTRNVLNAEPLDTKAKKPTVLFSAGGGENAVMYTVLLSDLASNEYPVLALDHPGETSYLQLPDIQSTLQEAVYRMRVSDMLAAARTSYAPFVASFNAPFDTTHFLAVGHSLGGAAAAGAMTAESWILGGVNLDGLFVDTPDVLRPSLMLAGAKHTPAIDPSWSPFSNNQSGWYQWLNVTGSSQNYSDLGNWVDIQGLRNRTITPSLGTIWGPRMDIIVKTLVEGFFGFMLGEGKAVNVPSPSLPEVVYVNGSSRGAWHFIRQPYKYLPKI